MSINIDNSAAGSVHDDSRQEARAPLAGTASNSPVGDVAIVEPPGTRRKKIAKAILDNSPALIGIGFIFAKGAFATYFLCWLSVSVAVIALVVDFFHCRRRWAAGLEAVFPKLIAATELIMNLALLGLLYGGVLKVDFVYVIKGCFIGGGFFIASAFSLLIRRPWIYASAVEIMPDEKMREINATPQGIAIFKEIMWAMTVLWTCVFFALFCISLICTIWKVHGGSQSATQIANIVLSMSVVVLATKCLQPQVIEKTKAVAIERVSSTAASAGASDAVENADASNSV